ncbi:tRNA (adenosine(37)-N6)-threonylcarbamoyltransferase complex ATPase subunit type 1 TsaE [Salinimonas sp. HHU 13199]|uniref:tRNA threonylcarbamoyladenosine biosynthesis protein TsaE n=1 Tax=Salinimonas profundi TaxID=2729140 RepID=A0ABR8LJJ2_9ALTE|nr:tRNA (adenosine(37)-N6)-threonylcarbamoyltransferase complex ATPase subunit type 1 TsaE [Salinimonas profundi]MBD3586360.1 tRNA (adenosine(37)-N6)-threonylcarbamoyltransferase complex ATPase subunit type 1 TsaE [Salinimonas profundi]
MTTVTYNFEVADEQHTQHIAQQLANALKKVANQGVVVHLEGDLGAGKTTFSRYFIQTLGHSGTVKSPTYTLVEPYELGEVNVYHFDLYRLADPEELEFMGIRDYFGDNTVCLVEWPERGGALLASADITITIKLEENVRCFTLTADSKTGTGILAAAFADAE